MEDNKKILSLLFKLSPLLISFIGTFAIQIGIDPFLIVPSDTSFHFDLMTVSTLFAGFLYTNYSILIGILDYDSIKQLNNTDIIIKRNRHIVYGIICAVVSICSGLLLVMFPETENTLFQFIRLFLLNLEITTVFFLIIYFGLSLKEMNLIIQTIHHKDSLYKDKEHFEKLREQIRTFEDEVKN